jgi:hypothetical protein
MSDLTWNEEVWCVTCGTTDTTRVFHRGHVISRSDMKQMYLPALNRGYRSFNNGHLFKHDEPWNMVTQCRECNYRTHASMAAINYPSCELEALWRELRLHSTIAGYLHLSLQHLAMPRLASGEVGKAAVKEGRAKSIDCALYAIAIMRDAMDLPTLRTWLIHVREDEAKLATDTPVDAPLSAAEVECERQVAELLAAVEANKAKSKSKSKKGGKP